MRNLDDNQSALTAIEFNHDKQLPRWNLQAILGISCGVKLLSNRVEEISALLSTIAFADRAATCKPNLPWFVWTLNLVKFRPLHKQL